MPKIEVYGKIEDFLDHTPNKSVIDMVLSYLSRLTSLESVFSFQKLNVRSVNTAPSTNFNAIRDSGMYYLSGSPVPTNRPSTSDSRFMVFVLSKDSTFSYQIAMGTTSGYIWSRSTSNGSTWTSWVALNTSALAAQLELITAIIVEVNTRTVILENRYFGYRAITI